MWFNKNTRVRLKCDLTKYDGRCKANEEGTVIQNGRFSMWDSEDRFGAVIFDNGARLSVLLKNLEILDK